MVFVNIDIGIRIIVVSCEIRPFMFAIVSPLKPTCPKECPLIRRANIEICCKNWNEVEMKIIRQKRFKNSNEQGRMKNLMKLRNSIS